MNQAVIGIRAAESVCAFTASAIKSGAVAGAGLGP